MTFGPFFDLVDIRQSRHIAWCWVRRLSGGKTIGGNGTTFDLQGRLINCEGDDAWSRGWRRTAR